MREFRKWVWTAVIAVAAAGPAAAQQGTITSSGGGQTTGSLSGTGGSFGGGAGQVGSGGSGGSGLGGSSSGSTGSQLQGSSLQTMTAPPKITAPTGQNSSSLSTANPFAGYYSNPYFQGLITAQTNATPGGFGAPLYGKSTTTTSSSTRGGLGSSSQSSQQSGILIPIPVQINYTAQMRFPTPPVAAGKMQTDLRVVLDNTSQIANPKAVQIIVDANNNVILRGNVADEDEARLVEGIVRLTPGVRAIQNELTATASASPGK
jgi:hypothetical protein